MTNGFYATDIPHFDTEFQKSLLFAPFRVIESGLAGIPVNNWLSGGGSATLYKAVGGGDYHCGLGFVTESDYTSSAIVYIGYLPNSAFQVRQTQDFSGEPVGPGSLALLTVRANGNVGIGTETPQARLDVNGTAGMTVCQITSDRNAKTEFKPVDGRGVLNKLAALPITTWAYTNNPSIRHLGPMAQDFAAAFAVGEDDKHIATVDADGVALAAIQGLHELLLEKDAKIRELEKRLETIERRFTATAKAGADFR